MSFKKKFSQFFTSITLLLCINLLTAFPIQIDTLKNRLENASGEQEKIEILIELAGFYWELQPDERIAYAEQAVKLAEKVHDLKSKANAYNHLGVAYNNLGNSEKSMDYFMKALKIMEQINDKSGIARSYRNIGQANFYMDNFDKALRDFQKSLDIKKESGDKKGISQLLILIGNVKAKTEKYNEALDYYLKALEIKKEIDDRLGISQIYNNLGNVYLALGEMENVLEYRLNALQIDRELGNNWEIALTTYNLAEYYLMIKQPEKAYPYIIESKELAEDLENKGLVRDNLENFSLYYEQKGDYQKALKYQRDYSELTKSMFSEKLSEKIAEMQIKYETEKKEKENQAYKLQLQKVRLHMQQLVFILAGVFLIVLFIYYRYRTKKKTALLLQHLVNERTQELQQKINELRQAKDRIHIDLKERETLLHEIHHRVKNNMQIIKSMIDLQAHQVTDKTTLNAFDTCVNRIQSMALVHELLYESSDFANIPFKEYVEKMTEELLRSAAREENISLDLKIEDISFGIKTAIPCGLILNELFSNSLKHAFPEGKKGRIQISLQLLKNKSYELIFRDNGVGIPGDIDFDKTESIGLYLIKILTGQIEGTVSMSRRNGTMFKIVFRSLK